ncbi:hypothetical protein BAY59_27380 [Prauserella coralliicola]|nr:hypothetical protein BAY59_27380 [Prauserella coralliicola]
MFFPSGDSAAATVSALAVFAIAFLVRPIGGLFFGHLDDRFGRRNVLSATILLMGLATTAIGTLPTYATIGIRRHDTRRLRPHDSGRGGRWRTRRRAHLHR